MRGMALANREQRGDWHVVVPPDRVALV